MGLASVEDGLSEERGEGVWNGWVRTPERPDGAAGAGPRARGGAAPRQTLISPVAKNRIAGKVARWTGPSKYHWGSRIHRLDSG